MYYNLGTCQILGGKYAEAKENLKKVLSMNPNFPLAHLNLGQALVNLGEK